MTVRYYSSSAGKMVLQLGVTAVATAIQVDTTAGLPGTTPFTLLLDVGLPNEEIVTVTQVSGNTLVVTRGEDGTAAQAHANGAVVRHAISARDLRDSRDHENSTSAHGTTSAVVGVSDAQALTNKNLSSPSNTFPSSLATDAEVTTAVAAEATARSAADTAHAGLTAAHGATGAVVGTTNVQTLGGKTLQGSLLIPAATGSAGATVRGLASQTGPLQVWQDNTPATLASVAADGTLAAPNIPASGVAGTSTGKASKRLHWGPFSGTTDNNGFVTVTHGAGFTPTVATFTPSTALQHAVDTIGATTFRLRVVSSDGSAPGSPVSVAGTFFVGE